MEVAIHKKTTIYLTTFAQNFYCLNTTVEIHGNKEKWENALWK